MLLLEGLVVVIAGVGEGLGRALALRAAQEGRRLFWSPERSRGLMPSGPRSRRRAVRPWRELATSPPSGIANGWRRRRAPCLVESTRLQ
ncbi:MAG: hypothetical protein JWO52_3641 [Gammaproteobacteria bacterium]|jgi:NAD(P)-dependent dehydrogenase (short-subunit alcohol dehydrogenase family)|nr:hypothetical protein [Gammaproteobacteria bacterium]